MNEHLGSDDFTAWNLFVLYFGGWTLQNKVIFQSKQFFKGHLGSRYILVSFRGEFFVGSSRCFVETRRKTKELVRLSRWFTWFDLHFGSLKTNPTRKTSRSAVSQRLNLKGPTEKPPNSTSSSHFTRWIPYARLTKFLPALRKKSEPSGVVVGGILLGTEMQDRSDSRALFLHAEAKGMPQDSGGWMSLRWPPPLVKKNGWNMLERI